MLGSEYLEIASELMNSILLFREGLVGSITRCLTRICSLARLYRSSDAWLDKANPPARATIQAPLAAPDILVEIMVTAAQGKSNM